MNWRTWLHGLLAAVINGVASGVILVIVDPADFNPVSGKSKLLTVSGSFGLIAAANYLTHAPLPAWDGVDRRGP